MKKKILYTALVLLSVLAILAPIAMLVLETVKIEPRYTNTFYGALDDKYERLTSIEEDKIVVVGGSSVAFGIDSELIEKYTGMPVVNFGLYADIGTKFMLDLSRSGIKEGDMVIVAPELDEQTLSLYFGAQSVLKASDENLAMVTEARGEDDLLALLGSLWNFNSEKIETLGGEMPDPEGIYNAKNFNEYGDIDRTKVKRLRNIMRTYYDKNKPVLLDSSIVSAEFIDYLNEYIAYCEGVGATVYFAFCPVNDLSVKEESDVKAFERFIKDSVNCKILGTLNASIIDSHYFYDTNFHLNDAGVRLHTVDMINDLLLELGDMETVVEEEVPEAPDYMYDVFYNGPRDENDRYFTYTLDVGYIITGLTEEGKKMEELTVPLGYDGYRVTELNTDIFAGSACKKLIIPENTNLGVISGNFVGADSLRELWIYKFEESELTPPSSFGNLSPERFSIFVPKGSNYQNGYSWEKSSAYIKEIKGED